MTPGDEAVLATACRRLQQVRSVAIVLAQYSNQDDVNNVLNCIAFDLGDIAADIDVILEAGTPPNRG